MDKLYDVNVNKALVLFISEVENVLDVYQYSLLSLFSYIFRRAVNDIYYGIYNILISRIIK